MKTIATFSIVACDLDRREWGVAVQSRFLAAAAVVSWARAGAGAVATQAQANMSYGPRGLDLLGSGLSAREAGERLVASDDESAVRQVGIEWAIEQSRELKEAGVPVLHYYSMGKSDNIQAIAREVF